MEEARQAADPQWKQLLRLGEQLVNQPTPDAQCERIVEVVGQLLSAQVRVWLARPYYPLPGYPIPAHLLPDSSATELAHRALVERQTQCEPDPSAEKIDASSPASTALPLTANANVLGVVQVDRPAGPPFSEHDLSLLEGLVTHASIAMEITRLEIINDWRYEQLNLVRMVSAQVASLTQVESLYEKITALIQETFDYDYIAIFMMDQREGVLRFRASASKTQSTPLQPGFTVRLGEGIIGTVGQSGTEIVALDVHQDQRYRFLEALPETQSEATLPLKVENRILGVLDFQSHQLNAFHENDMLVLRSLADNIALAIESTHLYHHLERHAEQITSVFEVGHALTSILDLDQLLNEVVRVIQNRFGYPFVHVYTVHPGRRLVIYQAGTGERSEAMKQQGWNYPLDAQSGIISWVARSGNPFLANDVLQEPLYMPSDVPPHETRAELAVPLMIGEEVLGVLDIQSREPHAFDDNDLSLFEALAAPVAVAMRNAYLYRSEQWRRKVAESFRDVAQLISANLPLNDLLDIILEKLESNLPCDASAIWMLEEDLQPGEGENRYHLRLAATRNLDPEDIAEALQDPEVRGMIEKVANLSEPVIRKPDEPLGPLGAALGFAQDYSSIAAPLRISERTLGVLTLAHNQNGRYGSEAQAITSTFASYAAVAIQNTSLYSETQEQALVSTMLLQVSEASQTILSLDDLLSTMIRLARLLMGVKMCAFLLWEEGLQNYQLKAWYGFEPNGDSSRLFSAQLPGLVRLASERTTLTLSNPAEEINLPEFSIGPGPGTILMLPLQVRNELTGAFVVGLQISSPLTFEVGFDPKALAILQGIAHQTAITVDNLRLLEARQEEAYVTAALLQVAQAVVSLNDLHDTLDSIVHLLPILVGIDTCIIYLWDSSSGLFRPAQVYAESRRIEEQILTHPFSPAQHNLLRMVRESGAMGLCEITNPDLDFSGWAALECKSYEQVTQLPTLPYGSWVLGCPLQMQDEVLGVLLVREAHASPTFWERRLEIIQGIAQQASLAIQNDLLRQEMVETERIDREIRLARQIQETFLPESLPEINRWEMDLRWETAREVGGDFYDIFRLGDNLLGLVIADVSDKGLPAALYMTVARTLIRANAAENQPPAQVLEQVNQLLVNDSTDSMFITVVYGVLSLKDGRLTYANAGHNRPLLFRSKTGVVEQLPKGGMALGIMQGSQIENHQISLYPGDALLLYTDGVTDLLSPENETFSEARLIDLVREHGGEPIQDILEHLDDAMLEFRRGTRLTDDVTLLAIRRLPAHRRKTKTPPAVASEG